MNLRFHWMLPKGGEIAEATAEATAAYSTQRRRRPGAGKWRLAARVPAFEQAGGSPARGSRRCVSRIMPPTPA